VGVRVDVANLLLGQSINIDEINTFQSNIFFSIQIVGTTFLGGLWALEWALMKQTCAAQEAQKSTYQIPTF